MKTMMSYFIVTFLFLLNHSAHAAIQPPTIDPEVSLVNFYTLTVNAQGGRVVSEPNGIDCDNSICIYSFAEGTYVALAAVAEQSFDQVAQLTSWSGDCSSTNEACRIHMTGAKSATASFGALGRPIASFTLTVNVGGAGPNVRVVSDPSGIDCSADDGTCSANFNSEQAVALSATRQDTTNGLVSSFFNWTGDCTSNSTACLVHPIDANKTVNANYIVLSEMAAFALASPAGANNFYQHPRVAPIVAAVDDIKPFGLGENGTDLRVKLPVVAGPVDIYLAVTVDSSDEVFLFNSSNGLETLSGSGLIAWKSGHDGSTIDETLFSNLNWELLPEGVYNFYVMITPEGDTSDHYLWKSYRNNNATVTNPFLE